MTQHHLLGPEDSVCIDAVLLARSDDPLVLRSFSADINLFDSLSTGLSMMGSIRGLVGWRTGAINLEAKGDAISADAETLGRAADQITDWLHDTQGVEVDTVVMIEMLRLRPQFRGQKLTGEIIGELVEVLSLDPATTLIVGQPEPQREEDGPMSEGPRRDFARVRLRSAFQEQGGERWLDTPVWWMRPAE